MCSYTTSNTVFDSRFGKEEVDGTEAVPRFGDSYSDLIGDGNREGGVAGLVCLVVQGVVAED